MGKAVCVSPRSEILKGARVFEQMCLQLLDPEHHKQKDKDMVK